MKNIKKPKRKDFSHILLLFDMLFISLSWTLAYWLRFALNEYIGKPINPYHVYLSGLPLVLITLILVYTSFGLYKRKKRISSMEDFHSLIKSMLLGSLVVMSVAFLFKEYDFGRFVIFFFIIINFIFSGLARYAVRRVEKAIKVKGGYRRIPTLIIGAGIIGIRAMQKLQDHPEIGYKIVGFLDDKKTGKVGSLNVLGRLEDVKKIVEEQNIQEVFVAIPTLPHKRLMQLVVKCENSTVDLKVVTDLFEVLAGETDFEVIEDFPIIELGQGLVGAGYEPSRRVFDLIISFFWLLIVLPLWIFIAIAIKLDSEGPVMFSQDRVGIDGKLFTLYKFRTMKITTGKYEVAPKGKEDNRVTKVGKFLRSSSLDELPQLVNVIKGEMSIVGPRPEMPFIVEGYEEWQKRRLDVKPGITGLWQILGRKDLPLHDNLEYDFYYIKNRSILFDLTILLKTIPAIIFRKGAY